MGPISDVAIPAVTFLLMLAVGHRLTVSELRRSATDVRAVVAGTVGQLLLLPLIATVIVLLLEPAPPVIAGLVLVAACPGGTISNFYTCIAHGNTALSVTLTACSCLLAFVTLPGLVAAGFFFWLDSLPSIRVPVTMLGVQLLALVVLPIVVGMVLRRWRAHAAAARDIALQRVSLAVLVGMVAYVVYLQRDAMVATLGTMALAAVLFTSFAMAAGYSLAWITGRPAADRLTFLIEFPCRNLALAVVVAITVLGRPDIVTFAAVLLLVQSLAVLILVAALRHERV